jgi:hypothetical protein
MNNDLLKYLSDQIQAKKDYQAESLSLGGAKDFGDYKYSCGIIRGLLLANDFIIEAAKKIEQNDED